MPTLSLEMPSNLISDKQMNAKEFLFGALPESDSPAGQLNPLDWKKTARMLVVLVAGTVATTLFDFMGSWLVQTDFGKYQFIVGIVVSSGLLELGRRKFSDFLANR